MVVRSFDRSNLRLLNAQLQEAVNKVADSYGISITVGATRFSANNATVKLELAVKDASTGAVKSADAVALERAGYGNKLNQIVNYYGENYRILGFRPKSWKFPVIAERVRDGARVKLPRNVLELRTGDVTGLLTGRAQNP